MDAASHTHTHSDATNQTTHATHADGAMATTADAATGADAASASAAASGAAAAASASHSSPTDAASASSSASIHSSSSSSTSSAPVSASEPETETMTMDDDDFLASLEAYERRGQRSRHSVSDPYIPPPLAAKLARLSGAPPPAVEPPKSPEQKAQESWDKSIGEYKDLKASKGKWRPAKKVWEVPEEALSPLPVSARDTPLPVSPAAADTAEDPPLRFSPRALVSVEDPLVSPEAEEQGWMETRLRLGDALTEPNSALSGFAPLNLRGAASAANIIRKASIDDDDGQPKTPSSPTSMTVSAEEFESMLLASPVKQARHSEAEHLQLLRAYLADLSAQFYTQSSCGARLVKHSKYGFPKVKVVKLNHETGVLSWGSGDIRIRDLVSMKLHRFSGSTLPSNAATNSIAAAAALAKSLAPANKPAAAVDGATGTGSDSPKSSSPSTASSSSSSPKAFKASSSAPTASATTPPPAKGHFLFTLTTAARALQLDAPTAFDRELWLLGLFNFHKTFVIDAAAAAAAAAASSKGRAAVPFNALHPVHPLQTINFEVMPTGEMRIKLTKESGAATPVSPTAAAAPLTHSPPLAGKSASNSSLSPSLGSSAALTSEPDFTLNKPWWHPSLMAPPAATAAAVGSPTPAPLLSASQPSASFLFHVSSGRASLIKHSRSGKPKVCSLTISKSGLVSWKGKETLCLADALDVVSGCMTQVFSKSCKGLKKPPAASACFSILMPARTLDLECYVTDEQRKLQSKRKGSADDANESPFDEAKQVELERDAWVTQLKRLIASLQTVNAKTVEENVELHENPLAPNAAAAGDTTAAATGNSSNGPSSPPKANGTAANSPPVAAFTFRPTATSPKGTSAAASANTTTAPATAASAPVVGWRRSIVSDAPLIIHDSDSDSDDEAMTSKPNGRRAAAHASDSSSDSDSDSSSSSDSELADDERATTAEDRERAYAEARLRLAATAGSKGAPAAVAAVDGHAQEVDSDSDEEDEEKTWETWQSDDAVSGVAASTSPDTDSSSVAAAGSEASGEDSALASLLRMEPVSAVQVPKTNEQLVAGSTAALVEQLQQRDATIRELQATVRRLTAQNAQLQAQLEANKVDALLLSSVLPQRSHARDKRR